MQKSKCNLAPARKSKLTFTFCLLTPAFLSVSAQPYIVSTIPERETTGVSPTAPVVFTFSEAMNAGATTVQFYKASPLTFYATSNYWNLGNSVLTCSPTPAFSPISTIWWNVTGANPAGDPLSDGDFFSTGPAEPTAPVLTNTVWRNTSFNFDVLALSGQTVTIEYSSLLLSNSWTSALTTNTPAAGRFTFSDSQSATNRFLFYRARTGS
jgi:hypothetical protein